MTSKNSFDQNSDTVHDPKVEHFFVLKKVFHFGKMYYFWNYLGVPNFGPFHFFMILQPYQLLTPFVLFFSICYKENKIKIRKKVFHFEVHVFKKVLILAKLLILMQNDVKFFYLRAKLSNSENFCLSKI